MKNFFILSSLLFATQSAFSNSDITTCVGNDELNEYKLAGRKVYKDDPTTYFLSINNSYRIQTYALICVLESQDREVFCSDKYSQHNYKTRFKDGAGFVHLFQFEKLIATLTCD